MRLEEAIRILKGSMLTRNTPALDTPLDMGCGCDLMSDVLSYIKPGSLLLTGLATPQVVYTAEMADIKVVCFVRGKRPNEEVICLAEQKGIILISTGLPMYESCGRLYQNGLKGCSEVVVT